MNIVDRFLLQHSTVDLRITARNQTESSVHSCSKPQGIQTTHAYLGLEITEQCFLDIWHVNIEERLD